jgi:1-acyl-sn-glycerol-3-phosphate acyltransferase
VRTVFLLSTGLLLMTLGSFAMLVARALTLGGARRFCAEVIGRAVGRAVLKIAGVRMVVHQEIIIPKTQTIYVANHSSTLDLFILMAMALPDTRFFMKRKYLLFGPLGFLAFLTGTFFTPPQSMPEKRARFFQSVERTLRRTGESAFLSPEGTRVTSGEIGPFNKGTFHLATNLKAPIVPLFIEIPREIDPGTGIRALPGTVHVYVKDAIPTSSWRLEELERNKEAVRERFVSYLEESRA